MKTIYLTKTRQRGRIFYTGVCDPRTLIKMAKKIEVSTEQEAQRPLNGKKVREVAAYVGDDRADGLLPTAIVLGTCKKDKLNVTKVIFKDSQNRAVTLYAMELPETPEEFKAYADTLDIMDGQHRLFSFHDDYRILKDETAYEVPFTIYITPTLKERQQIFKATNEKQEKVSPNLLMWFREQLKMLNEDEMRFHQTITLLNNENCSPLCSRIIMGAERIKKGYQGKQLISILKKAKLDTLEKIGSDHKKQLQIISTYLSAWEDVCAIEFINPKKEDAAATKISGLRYMLLLLPSIWQYCITNKKGFTRENCVSILSELPHALGGIEDVRGIFTSELYRNNFRSEGATVSMADQHTLKLRQHLDDVNSGGFDPLSAEAQS